MLRVERLKDNFSRVHLMSRLAVESNPVQDCYIGRSTQCELVAFGMCSSLTLQVFGKKFAKKSNLVRVCSSHFARKPRIRCAQGWPLWSRNRMTSAETRLIGGDATDRGRSRPPALVLTATTVCVAIT